MRVLPSPNRSDLREVHPLGDSFLVASGAQCGWEHTAENCGGRERGGGNQRRSDTDLKGVGRQVHHHAGIMLPTDKTLSTAEGQRVPKIDFGMS